MPLGGNAIELLDRYEASIEALLRDIESAGRRSTCCIT